MYDQPFNSIIRVILLSAAFVSHLLDILIEMLSITLIICPQEVEINYEEFHFLNQDTGYALRSLSLVSFQLQGLGFRWAQFEIK